MPAISISTLGAAYTQDFNTLISTGTDVLNLSGWAFSEAGTAFNTTYTAGTGSSTTGNTYSFGANLSTERAFGTLQSGSLTSTIGAEFNNASGGSISSLNIAYTGEQWRLGQAARTDQLSFEYSLDATSLTTGTWTSVTNLNFVAPVTTGTAGAIDGNAVGNKTALAATISGLSIAAGQTFWIRWLDFNATGSDDGLAIDDFSLTALGAADTTPPTVIGISTSIGVILDSTTTFSLMIVFSEAMNTGIAPVITFPVENPSATLTSTGGSWSGNTYTATYTVVDANIDLALVDVRVASAQDVAGNVMVAATTANVFSISQVNPTLVSSTPADNDINAVPASDITVTFSETVTIANAAGIELRKVSDNSVVASVLTALGTTLTINPNATLASGESYYVSIAANALTDSSGNGFAGLLTNTALNFTTATAPVPTITVVLDAPTAQAEGNSGQVAYSYTVTWSDIPADTIISYTMSGGGANPATVGGPTSDLNTLSGSFGITAGSGTFTLNSISVLGDTNVELDEQFQLSIDPVVGVTIIQPGLATITNDDTAAAVAISNVSITEGNAGTQLLTFTVVRTGGNAPFTVDYATSDGTATIANGDYAAATGTLSFLASDTSKTFTVTVNGDTAIEPTEAFNVTLSNATNGTTITTASATGTITNDDFTKIHDIQGTSHLSTMVGTSRSVEGIVTGTVSTGTVRGYYVQEEDADADADIGTSEGIFVFTGAVSPTVSVGQKVQVTGTVTEFRASSPAPTTNNLTLTQLASATVTVVSSGNALPTAILVGDTGRNPVSSSLGDDPETGVFNPATEATDFWESLEGMRVTIDNPTAAGPFRNSFGELVVLANGGESDGSLNSRGSVTIRDNTPAIIDPALKSFDFNGERIQIDDGLDGGSTSGIGSIKTGDAYADITGIVNYAFGFYEVNIDYALTTQTASTLAKETTTIVAQPDRIRMAGFNVENLSPVGTEYSTGQFTTQAKIDGLAAAIVSRLGAPDILALQEVQDNDGILTPTTSTVTSASLTLTQLLAAIVAAGGPQYVAIDAPPGDDMEGGAPGGNIRTAYLYNPNTVKPLTTLVDVVANVKQYNGARIGDGNTDFASTRHSLPIEWTTVADELQAGSSFWTINNHFSSKGGSGALIGTQSDGPLWDEPVNGSATKREGQATAVNTYIDGILGNANTLDNRVLALGDFNDYQFFPVADIVAGKIIRTTAGTATTPSIFAADAQVLRSLMETLPEAERYTYNFDGNAQALDHIMVSTNLYASSSLDIVHINSEFNANDRLSDHDPSVVQFLSLTSTSLATAGADVLNQATYVAAYGSEFGSLAGANRINALGGNDTVTGGGGNDSLNGGTGIDTSVYSGARTAYTVSKSGTNLTVSGATDGSDTLTSFERVTFGSAQVSVETYTPSSFNNDLRSDLAWGNTNGGAGVFLMNGALVTSGHSVGPVNGADWRLKATADLNGDGKSDFVWQNSNGLVATWLMDGVSSITEAAAAGNPGAQWTIAGVGDLNGDAQADIVFSNSNGEALVWLMNGTSVMASATIGPANGAAWRVQAVGDVTGDSRADLIWESTDGRIVAYEMNGLSISNVNVIANEQGLAFSVRGVSDMNGDGTQDIVWQYDDGLAGIWTIGGSSIQSSTQVGSANGPDVTIRDISDLNGDAQMDLVWQVASTGQAVAWLMNGTSFASSAVIGAIGGSEWYIV
jgi:predicted extracellular nuclease/methionine-rich copper-binding protein CopC